MLLEIHYEDKMIRWCSIPAGSPWRIRHNPACSYLLLDCGGTSTEIPGDEHTARELVLLWYTARTSECVVVRQDGTVSRGDTQIRGGVNA